MKILLINPPRSVENGILKHAPLEALPYIHKKLVGPPLGLLTIAAVVKDFDVSVFDMKGEYDLNPQTPPLRELTLNILNRYQPDVVGVTFIASEFDFGMEIFREVKKFDSRITTVAGGLHATLCPGHFTDPAIDLVCPGQSAYQFREIIIAKESNRRFEEICGILINQKNGTLKESAGKPKTLDPAGEDFIEPDRSFLRPWLDTYKMGDSPHPVTYLYSSLGCPYKCTFCSIWPQFKGRFFQRKIESIISELKSTDDYSVVRFADANTIVNVDFIHELFDVIEEEKIKKNYVMDIRVDTVVKYPDLIEKLARNGLKVVICGFESFRDEELKKYKKQSSATLIHQAVEIFHRNRIKVRGNYVVPHTYSEDDFDALAEYASAHKIVYAGYTILSPMPGTEFYDEVEDQIIDHDLKKYNFFNCVLKTRMPLEKFYENTAKLWLIKEGKDVL